MPNYGIVASVVLASGLFAGELTPHELQPATHVDLRPALNTHVRDFGSIHAFSVIGDRFHLLVRSRSAGMFTVVRMDLAGNVLRAVPLQLSLVPNWLTTDPRTGDDYVWRQGHPTRPNPPDAVYRVAADGRIDEAAVFDRRLQMPARIGEVIWGLASWGCQPAGVGAALSPCMLSNGDPSARAHPYQQYSAAELVSIEPFIPALIRLNPSTGRVVSRRVMSPEVLHAQAETRRNPATALILGAYALSDGSIWTVVLGQPLAKGAAILRLDEEGEVRESLRCELFKDSSLANAHNPDGYMLPSMLGISGGKVYILSSEGLVSACYLLPRT